MSTYFPTFSVSDFSQVLAAHLFGIAAENGYHPSFHVDAGFLWYGTMDMFRQFHLSSTFITADPQSASAYQTAWDTWIGGYPTIAMWYAMDGFLHSLGYTSADPNGSRSSWYWAMGYVLRECLAASLPFSSSSGGGGGGSSAWDTTKIDELIAEIGTLNITAETPYAIGTGDF